MTEKAEQLKKEAEEKWGIKSAIIEGLKHNTPSPETLKMIGDLNTKLLVNQQVMEDLIKKVEDGFKQNSDQHKEIMDAFKEAMDGKANRWVETIMSWFLYTIAGVTVLGVCGLIIEALIHFNTK